MKDFPHAKIKTEFVNDFGETMKLVVDSDDQIWVHHDDCNNDYVELDNFKYVLNSSEIVVITCFIALAKGLYNIDNSSIDEFIEFQSKINNEIFNISLN